MTVLKLPDCSITNLFAFSQLPAQIAQLFLLFRREPAHDLGNAAGVVRKDSFDELCTRRCDGGQDKTLVFAPLLAFYQAALLQVVDYQSQIAAAGENAPRQVAQALRPNVIQRFQNGKLAQRQPLFFQTNAGVRKGGAGGALQLDVGAERALLCG